jgi:alkylation response protein AidB-like acyl-CoA dehydrogenase
VDFRFSEADEAWRREVREFLEAELPDHLPRQYLADEFSDEVWPFYRAFREKLAARHWIAPHWPSEYGGLGIDQGRYTIFIEEMAYGGAPYPGHLSVNPIGNAILAFGNEAQKRRFLPGIAEAREWWCQGFSEPNVGSDLAALQTRAAEDGDDFIVDGVKTWNTGGHRAQWCYLAVRTNPDVPKHRGISLLLVDMASPGVSVRPIISMVGRHQINEVRFEHVRVPRANLLGEKDRGWYYIAATLDFERTNVVGVAIARRQLEETIAYAKRTRRDGRLLAEDPVVRDRLAQLAVEIEIGEMFTHKVMGMLEKGLIPNREASAAKCFQSELGRRVAAGCMEVLGPYLALAEGAGYPLAGRAPLRGALTAAWLESFSKTIAAGTSEIQRNIIAQRGLGMPRD